MSCFERSLRKKRDAGFFVFGQLSRFTQKLCVRCPIDRCVPDSKDWNSLLSIRLDGQQALLPEDFLLRLILSSKLEQALRKKAVSVSVLCDKKMDRARADSSVEELPDEFCISARNYYLFLIKGVRKHFTKTTQ